MKTSCNRYKYSPRGGPVMLCAETSPDCGFVKIHIRDQGMGMTLVKEIIELHGGSVEIRSALGAGTRHPQHSCSRMKRPKILIVDDEPAPRHLIHLALAEIDAELIDAENGTEAIEAVHRHKPDLVVLDIILRSHPDGLDVCRTIKQTPELRDIQVILSTSRAQATDIAEGFKAGADRYMTRPFSPAELLRVTRDLLRGPTSA